MTAPAMVHVDLDSLSTVAAFMGITVDDPRSLVHAVALPRFLELFREHAVKATFFVVGADLDREDNVKTLRQAISEGHEIANHTQTHPFGLTRLSTAEKEHEIGRADDRLRSRLGVEPVGFRAPGYDVDEEVLEILRRRGYRYDSSLYPSFLVPAIKAYTAMRVSAAGGAGGSGYGDWRNGFGPLGPYRPCADAMLARGHAPFHELPVSVLPVLRFPLHSTAIFSSGMGLFHLGDRILARFDLPYTLLLHGVDLLDRESDGVPASLGRFPSLRRPLSWKRPRLATMLRTLARGRGFVRSVDYVSDLESASSSSRPAPEPQPAPPPSAPA